MYIYIHTLYIYTIYIYTISGDRILSFFNCREAADVHFADCPPWRSQFSTFELHEIFQLICLYLFHFVSVVCPVVLGLVSNTRSCSCKRTEYVLNWIQFPWAVPRNLLVFAFREFANALALCQQTGQQMQSMLAKYGRDFPSSRACRSGYDSWWLHGQLTLLMLLPHLCRRPPNCDHGNYNLAQCGTT